MYTRENEPELTQLEGNKRHSIITALLFIAPSLVVNVVSIILFAMLHGFTASQHNTFSAIIISAVILSLVGTAGMQLLVYRINDEDTSQSRAAKRNLKIGVIYTLPFSIVISALLYFGLQSVQQFSISDFIYAAILIVLYSLVWTITAIFWATEKYEYPAVIFSFSYLIIFILTYGIHLANPNYTITGYTIGVAIMLLLSYIAVMTAFRKKTAEEKQIKLSSIWTMASHNLPAIFFHVFFILGIFLDKIIVWVTQGLATGQVLVVTGVYTMGSFLGLIPIFSIGAIAYFSNKVRPLVKDLYSGKLTDIMTRTQKYKHLYWKGLTIMTVTGISLFLVVTVSTFYLFNNFSVIRILVTISAGTLFFLIIVYDSTVLPLFGKTWIAMTSMAIVCLAEIMAIPFVQIDVWYAALGFLVGSFIGALVSQSTLLWLFSAFEYHIFHFVAVSA